MEPQEEIKTKRLYRKPAFWIALILYAGIFIAVKFQAKIFKKSDISTKNTKAESQVSPPITTLDVAAYDKKLLEIANLPIEISASSSELSPSPNEPSLSAEGGHLPQRGRIIRNNLWPVKAAYPNAEAILPFNRIVAYYGNLYSKNMGVLGEYPEDEMLARLDKEVKKWQAADPNTPVIPALHYITVVAQAGPGRDGKYRARMPDDQIERVLKMAEKVHGLVFLDIQVGGSNVQTEVPLLEKYLKFPNVHLGIDPEFAMTGGARPGTAIGTLDAADINFAAEYLSTIVKQNHLPPKVLVVHRFTKPMLTNYKNITPLPEVQIVVNMDGFGAQANKLNTYKQYVYKEPVQFTGFKLFYKNDAVRGPLLTPDDLIKLSPIPVYIQYQ